QEQALRDTFITGIAYELADGLGQKLGAAYQSSVSHTSKGDCIKTLQFTSNLPAVGRVIGFANATEHADSDAGKYFFANETRDGKEQVSLEAMTILRLVNGHSNALDKAYKPSDNGDGTRTCSGPNPIGNSRPFQTEPRLIEYQGKDFCGAEST